MAPPEATGSIAAETAGRLGLFKALAAFFRKAPRIGDDLTEKSAGEIAKETEKQIDRTLHEVNPKFDRTQSAYSENCTGVVQANELRRRGIDVKAGPLETYLRSDQNGPGGRSLGVIEQAWGRKFTEGTKADIEHAFKEPGSRGVVAIRWHGGGGHVFNVENVDGTVRFVDGQPTPPITDASHYFLMGGHPKYVRLDDLPTPTPQSVNPYIEP